MPTLQAERAAFTYTVERAAMTAYRAIVVATIRTPCRGEHCGDAVEFGGLLVGTIGRDGQYHPFSEPLKDTDNRRSGLGERHYQAACTDCGSLMQLLPDTAYLGAIRGVTTAEEWNQAQAAASTP